MSVYAINKGVNRPIVFKGLKGQYIGWMGVGVLGLLLLFSVLYVLHVPIVICLVLVFGLGALLFRIVFSYSCRYVQHGLMKRMASRYIPKVIKCDVSIQ